MPKEETVISNMLSKPRSTLLAVALAVALGGTMLTGIATPAWAQQMTDVGTPRAETLIVDMLNARVGNPENMNMYQQGVTINHGYHQMAGALLYDIDTAKGMRTAAFGRH